jgi:hypothetical protein
VDKKQFNKLQVKWDKKLKKSGFIDLEPIRNGRLTNTTESNGVLDKRRDNRWEAEAEYYRLATYFLNDYEFESNFQRIIWEYHANGISYRNIVKILKKVKRKTDRQTICEIIRELREIMLKMYGISK